ncbi:probable LRR receptor-like serine/threonine-protein kinase At1g06840 isoform X2 [Populus nigra]|nr:probable LRR receptor-like serine/threonine-protein kinase At1g06840 isoform X2 [Populus nigra]XP_061954287.1 probable LRR receptor-like serine/threonine-protein kinase At1g06840 isoform X2 [Populus nigra]XP_061954288.1 probable LRR receptor-like serine/threonine-protein kinase At1g06840 isoform X2 [Populus nigra]
MSWMRSLGCVFVLSYCYLVLQTDAQITDPSEVAALKSVKKSLVDPLKHLSSWKRGDPCASNWTGIFCFDTYATDGYLHVRELQLLNMNLSGHLTPELGQLSRLVILDFMWNELDGNIPKEIGNISSLQLLLLNGNKLSGFLPDELGYLSKLDRLQVDMNYISGPIPTSFANLSKVKHLHMNNNSIRGQIPPELSKLSTLRHLLLDNNNLSGYLPPEFSNLPELRILQLDNNKFIGSGIPDTYGNLSKLAKLSLRNCSLQGSIPGLSSIQNLLYLDLSKNELNGPLPPTLSDNITTIDLSHNHLNGSIPRSFSNLPSLQRLSLENNLFIGYVSANMWQNMSSTKSAGLTLDLRNNSLSSILGEVNPPENVTLRLGGNPICHEANTPNIIQFCEPEAGGDKTPERLTNSKVSCYVQSCPTDDFFEYVASSPVPCFCAAPLRIGYRLKSPSFSYFTPHVNQFEQYVTRSLNMSSYQLSIDSFFWEEGPRLRMYLKLFPPVNNVNSTRYNATEVKRLRDIFASWQFPPNDFFGPYDLLNFTLLGPYAQMNVESHKEGISKGVWAAIILAAIACAIVIISAITVLIIVRNARYSQRLPRKDLSLTVQMKIDGVESFTFKEIVLATNNFNSSTQIGQGGYGKVYRGVLPDKTVVAIKRAEEGSLQGEKEFLTEIKLLSRLHHRNLVSLTGYCVERGEQMLVYEFMPNGTLRDWLSDKEKLSFGTRLSIALGSAKGILYLHTEADPPVFHRDIKASNILLDSKLTAKVADFGLSLLAPVMDDDGYQPNHVSTVVKGTPGYLDPEYFLTRKLTDKSDVYSLGVVFLELLTGMQPIYRGKNIVREVNIACESDKMFSIIDRRMGSYPSKCIERFVVLALRCCHDKQDKRPSMLEVVRELENILRILPETETTEIDSASAYSRKTTPTFSGTSASSSSFCTNRDISSSSSHLGSDLSSGVIPFIPPR